MSGERLLIGPANGQRQLTKRLEALRIMAQKPTKARLDAFVLDDMGVLNRSIYDYNPTFVINNQQPWLYYAQCGGYAIYIWRGINNQTEGQDVYNGYTGNHLQSDYTFPARSPNGDPWHAYAESIASKFIYAGSPFIPLNTATHIGYSFGGCIAMSAALRTFAFTQLDFPATVVAVASPKIRGQLAQISERQIDSYFLGNDEDPVPTIPPTLGTFTRMMAGLSVFEYAFAESFKYWPSGSLMTQLLTINAGTQPMNFSGPAFTEISSWMARSEAGAITPHSINVYENRWAAIVRQTTQPTVINPSGPQPTLPNPIAGPAIPDPVTPLPQIRRMVSDNQSTVFTDATRQNTATVVIPDTQLFTAERNGRVWSVYFGGIEVATAPKKRRALALKNEGNAFIRRLQNEGVVYVQALAEAWVEYLQLASDPTTGFRPTLNTTP